VGGVPRETLPSIVGTSCFTGTLSEQRMIDIDEKRHIVAISVNGVRQNRFGRSGGNCWFIC